MDQLSTKKHIYCENITQMISHFFPGNKWAQDHKLTLKY